MHVPATEISHAFDMGLHANTEAKNMEMFADMLRNIVVKIAQLYHLFVFCSRRKNVKIHVFARAVGTVYIMKLMNPMYY